MTAIFCSGAGPFCFLVLLPLLAGAAALLLQKKPKGLLVFTCFYAVLQLIPAALVFARGAEPFTLPLTGGLLELRFATGRYSALFLLLAAIVFSLVSVYSAGFLQKHAYRGRFLLYLFISLSMINGAFLSDNLAGMLFFWEGLLCTLFLSLLIGNRERPATAVKALVISGTADLLLMGGIIATGIAARTLTTSAIHDLPLTGVGAVGFTLMFLGAVGKAGCMPFHSWIPDAASDAPLPFMTAFPGALEKLVGIYLAVRLVYDLYDVVPGKKASTLMMTLGVVTILLAVGMALIQKDMKRLMAYHAVSQVGYMVLGIGTALPVGLVGALFHMLNNAVYKSCLFMTAGCVEQRTGTTDARQLGGLSRLMPVTAVSFTLSALGIAGVPPWNGFFSKELIFDAALESGLVFYIGALLGAVMTAISFLKLGRALFTGKTRLPEDAPAARREAPLSMLLPMGLLALASLFLGLGNRLPIDRLFGASLGLTESFSGWPKSLLLVLISLAALALAAADHIFGCRMTGSPITAADHIHNAPVLKSLYALAERGVFDPYLWLTGCMNIVSLICVRIERGVSWFYDKALVRAAKGTGNLLSRLDNGRVSRYVWLSFAGLAFIVAVFLAVLLSGGSV